MVESFQRYADWLTATGAPGKFGSSGTRGIVLTKYQIGSGGFVPPDGRLRWFLHT